MDDLHPSSFTFTFTIWVACYRPALRVPGIFDILNRLVCQVFTSVTNRQTDGQTHDDRPEKSSRNSCLQHAHGRPHWTSRVKPCTTFQTILGHC